MYFKFVDEIYCPMDPCTQVTAVANNAPDSICGLLRCNNGYREGVVYNDTPAKPDTMTVLPEGPLTCEKYVTTITDYCRKKPEDGNAPRAPKCEGSGFVKQGCEIVKHKLEEAMKTTDICSVISCDALRVEPSLVCSQTLNLVANATVPINEYILATLVINNTVPILAKRYGIEILEATAGYDCPRNLNNYLSPAQEQCQNRPTCTLTLPRMAPTNCGNEYEIQFTCAPEGKVHKVYTHEKLDSVFLDCREELPPNPPLNATAYEEHFQVPPHQEAEAEALVSA
jgi:hypothetical protein